MKATLNPKKQSDKFGSILSYSRRYTAAANRPPLTAGELRAYRSISSAIRESSPDLPQLTKSSTLPPTSSHHTQIHLRRNLVLKPLEVLLPDYILIDQLSDQLFTQAFSLRAEGRFQNAAEIYEEMISGAIENIQARINLGVCYMKLALYSSAREVYESGPADDYRLLYNLGILYTADSQDYKAKTVLQRALLLSPDHIKPLVEQLLAEVVYKLAMRTEPSQHEESSKKTLEKCKTAVEGMREKKPPLGSIESLHDSLSPRGLTTQGSLETPKLYLSKIYKVDEDEIRPISPWSSLKPKTSLSRNRSKKTFITAPPLPRMSMKSRKWKAAPTNTVPEPSCDLSLKEKTKFQRVRMISGFVEEDLEDERTLRQAEVDPDLVYSVKSKAIEVSNVLRKEVNKLHGNINLLPKADLDPILGWKLSDEVLSMARGELSKEPEERDLKLLVELLSKLKFFSKFHTDVRVKFLKIGIFQAFSQGHVIFQQGDQGGYMYVILHGSVTVKRSAPIFGSDPIIINTLYDGDSFGELTLFGSQITGSSMLRSASCIAAEHTDLLMIEKERYHEIMVHEIETQLETKINFLISLPFLQGTPKFNLIPLASNMDPRTYCFNDPILNKGDIPTGLHIILSGHCSVYSEGFCIRPKRLSGYASARIRKEPKESFQFGITQSIRFKKPKKHAPEEVPLRAISLETINSTPGLRQQIQSFLKITDIDTVLKDSFITYEKLQKSTLKEMDFFGGRALLDVTGAKPLTGESLKKIEPSKFSVVAESAQVKIFLITRSLLPLLGEKLMDQIKSHLVDAYEPDCPQDATDEDIVREFNAWNAYKADIIDEARRMQFLEKTENRGKSAQQLL